MLWAVILHVHDVVVVIVKHVSLYLTYLFAI